MSQVNFYMPWLLPAARIAHCTANGAAAADEDSPVHFERQRAHIPSCKLLQLSCPELKRTCCLNHAAKPSHAILIDCSGPTC